MMRKRKGFQEFLEKNIEKAEEFERLPAKVTKEAYMDELDQQFGLNVYGVHKTAVINLRTMMKREQIKYREEYGPLLIYHMMKGHSFESFGAVVHVKKGILDGWIKEHSIFNDCYEIALNCQKLGWENIIQDTARGYSRGNAAAIIFAIKNYFPEQYKDKREVETNHTTIVISTGINRKGKNEIVDATCTEIKELQQIDISSESEALGEEYL